MSTRKLLVAFDPANPEHQSKDFLVVVLDGTQAKLVGIKSNKFAASGLMVYLGREIKANDLFAKLVDKGRRVDGVEQTHRMLENYIQQLQDFRIGNLLGVEADAANGFKLVKLADTPSRAIP